MEDSQAATGGRRDRWGWLLLCEVLVLFLPLLISAAADPAGLGRLGRALLANPFAYGLGFLLLGFPALLTIWITLNARARPDWQRALWVATGAMGLASLSICGTAQFMGEASAALRFAWPLTALVQAVALGMMSVMWWVFRLVARANRE
jgi:hypothetical protein